MAEIHLNDLLNFDLVHEDVKIRFMQYNSFDNPIDVYRNNPEEVNTTWLFWRSKQRYFHIGQIAVCLLKMDYDKWLLTTIKRITEELDVVNGVNYKGEELKEYQAFYGRVIIQYHKPSQAQGRYFSAISDELIVNQLLPDIYDGFDFPGYDKVCLSWGQLNSIITNQKKDWVNALSAQKAVYLITDKSTGKLYVGSATGECMLLQRWTAYSNDGHGGNKMFKEIVRNKGFSYVKKYFQYSILENYNYKTEDSYIIQREAWWKDILCSRQFGYNSN